MTVWSTTLGEIGRRHRRAHDPLIPGDPDSLARLLVARLDTLDDERREVVTDFLTVRLAESERLRRMFDGEPGQSNAVVDR